MTKDCMIAYVAEKSGMTKKQASLAFNATLEGIIETLKAGERISFIGFGTFTVIERKARAGINPKTKEKIMIPATKVPVFRAGTKLKDSIK